MRKRAGSLFRFIPKLDANVRLTIKAGEEQQKEPTIEDSQINKGFGELTFGQK